ncbi:MAG: 6,7-dimethyl-8-ribityllumazine synthase [Bacteroidia bacterium]|jgi:6,7-dimethyl-8-ribityllumazine synthase|nr:6,7-dimethyl-8-ribityllumazine synthase [Bacteroidia bacterium]MCC6769021.1 6,7-dimethyl-8-ribityllumazine synthase [Bacteroidia bacterium]
MSSADQNLTSAVSVEIPDVDQFHFTVLVAKWNREITAQLEKACIDRLVASGARLRNIRIHYVPGAWELISATSMALDITTTNAVICIGCVIRGETPHFDYICQGVTNGLAAICARQNIPVIYGVLTVDSKQQALDRCGGKYGNKGDEAALTALEMMALGNALSEEL